MMDTTGLPLAGWRVLVTRPPAQAEHWCQTLAALGATPLRAPLMAIEPFAEDAAEADAIRQRLANLSQYHHAIFVSQNAVAYGLHWLTRLQRQMPSHCQCYAVGEATARALRHAGLPVAAAAGAMNSEALLALPSLGSVFGQRIVIFRGQGGRPLLAEVLAARGAQVDYCELYRRTLPSTSAALIDGCEWGAPTDLVAVHSGESLENWATVIAQLGRPDWRQLPVLVPGERVAALASQIGFGAVIVAANATDEAMAKALADWHTCDGGP